MPSANATPEEKREYRRKYWAANRERLLAQQRERGKRNYAANPQAYARRNRKARLQTYGLTESQYQAMLASQGGKCAICETTQGRRKSTDHPLYVDHDHATGKVRGLLCQPCNSALGMFEDDVARLRKAIAYLSN